MKKLAILIMLFNLSLCAYAKYSGGTGEPDNPYLIATPEDLNAIGDDFKDWDKHFLMTADINMAGYTGTQFNIIGNDELAFTGVFDGNNKTIHNFTYTNEDDDLVALFGKVDGYKDEIPCEIRNVIIKNPNIFSLNSAYTTALVANLYGARVSNCSVIGGNITGGIRVSALVGANNGGIIVRCYTECNVFGMGSNNYSASSIVSSNNGHISNCFSAGSIVAQGPKSNAGGLVGSSGYSTSISNCYSITQVDGAYQAGGLVSECYGTCVVENCYSAGLVTCSGSPCTKIGGLIGKIDSKSKVMNSFWDKDASTQSDSGAGIGLNTHQMKDPNTFINAGWDFINETNNGVSDFWAPPDNTGYIVLWWQKTPLPSLPAFAGGSGKKDDPYLISTPNQLNSIGANPRLMKSHYKMVNNIDLVDTNMFLIGDRIYNFEGSFDGNNHTISNFTYSCKEFSYLGLFRIVHGPDSVIKNLRMIDPNLFMDSGHSSGSLVGTLVSGEVFNCSIAGGTITGYNQTGGIVGNNDSGLIVNCLSDTNVSCSDSSRAGGIVGRNHEGIIFNSTFLGSISGRHGVGGITGFNDGTVLCCQSNGWVNGSDFHIGGIIGWNRGRIISCFSKSYLYGGTEIGGIAGENNGLISNCCSMSFLSSNHEAGGIAGIHNSKNEIKNCYFAGSFEDPCNTATNSYKGPIVGYLSPGNGKILNCLWDSEVTGFPDGNSTAQMQDINTYLAAGWDFKGESENGTSSFWTMEPNNYPCLYVFDVNFVPYEFEGNGTKAVPYRIYNADDLGAIWQNPQSHYTLLNDINLASIEWSASVIPFFTGTFEGNGNVISNFVLSSGSTLGLIGYFSGNGGIFNLGLENLNINGVSYIGGLCGENYGATIVNCYATGSIKGNFLLGGLCGENKNSILNNCHATVSVSGSSQLGGLCAQSENVAITDSYATGSIAGTDFLGGLCGESRDTTFINCHTTGSVAGHDKLGGLCGKNDWGIVINCYATGSVTGSDYLGGLTGESKGSNIRNSYATGSVAGVYLLGGLCGINHSDEVNNCYATGSVTGDSRVGGLCGFSRYTAVNSCYSIGSVTGDSSLGGLCGIKYESVISDSFWDIETSGMATSDGGVGKTTIEMQKLQTFTDAGWDFNTPIWEMCPDTNDYPHLWWEYYCITAPVANAGPNQIVYACFDELVDVTLDGSASYDEDGDELDYYWSWVIDGNVFEANGVSPTIQLPVGEDEIELFEIELVVDDGIDFSEPDYCTITVVAPLRVDLAFTPRVINTKSKGQKVSANLQMPSGIGPEEIADEPLMLYPGDIAAEHQQIGQNRHNTTIHCMFERNSLLNALDGADSQVTAVGRLTSGQYFCGTDTIRIIK